MNTNGYRPSHRNRWFLLQNKILTRDELLLFEYYLDQMDFDCRHTNYATFKVNFSSIALLFGYTVNQSNNSIRTKHKQLLKLGFIRTTPEKNIFTIHNTERYIAQTTKWKGKVEDFRKSEMNQPIENIIQNIATNVQSVETNFQLIEKKEEVLLDKNTPRSLASSKVKSKFVTSNKVNKNNVLRSDDKEWIENNY